MEGNKAKILPLSPRGRKRNKDFSVLLREESPTTQHTVQLFKFLRYTSALALERSLVHTSVFLYPCESFLLPPLYLLPTQCSITGIIMPSVVTSQKPHGGCGFLAPTPEFHSSPDAVFGPLFFRLKQFGCSNQCSVHKCFRAPPCNESPLPCRLEI